MCSPSQFKDLLNLSFMGHFAALVAESEGLLFTISRTQMAVSGLETL